MIYGLYLSGQGAETQSLRQAVLANNLANAGTTAFKPDVPVFRAHLPFDVVQQNPVLVPDTLEQQTGGVELAATVTDFTQGPLKITNGNLDVAIMGPGFLKVSQGNQTFLTRNGNLTLDTNRQLVTTDGGDPILGADGAPIEIPAEVAGVNIGPDGMVSGLTAAGAQAVVGQIALVEPDDGVGLMKQGDSLYAPQGKTKPAVQAQLRQGMLEESGVQPVESMVELIQTARAFEMNMSLLRYQDEMLGQLIQSIPRR
jgi:flagellar basal body rod protein FlgG